MKAHPDERELHDDELVRLRVRRVGDELGISVTVRNPDTGEIELRAGTLDLLLSEDPTMDAVMLWNNVVNKTIAHEIKAELLKIEMEAL